jgi:pyridoxal phosphate enzyme (YggS family)
VHTIHAIDSLRLLQEINKVAATLVPARSQPVRCLLQLHIAQEETKFGFTPHECTAMLVDGQWQSLSHIRLAGIMAMATNTDNQTIIQTEFQQAAAYFRTIKSTHFADDPTFAQLSLGMTADYPIAISAGSTIVRIGTRIFGNR